jgi:hypothetical protein
MPLVRAQILAAVGVLFVSCLSLACGDDSSPSPSQSPAAAGPSETVEPGLTPETLSEVALQPADVPPGLAPKDGNLNTTGAGGSTALYSREYSVPPSEAGDGDVVCVVSQAALFTGPTAASSALQQEIGVQGSLDTFELSDFGDDAIGFNTLVGNEVCQLGVDDVGAASTVAFVEGSLINSVLVVKKAGEPSPQVSDASQDEVIELALKQRDRVRQRGTEATAAPGS